MAGNPNLRPEQLYRGVKVKLKGPREERAPRKPYPLGWQEVAEVGASVSRSINGGLVGVIKVTSDERWLPADLIEEIVP
jgi:hypothetical protein